MCLRLWAAREGVRVPGGPQLTCDIGLVAQVTPQLLHYKQSPSASPSEKTHMGSFQDFQELSCYSFLHTLPPVTCFHIFRENLTKRRISINTKALSSQRCPEKVMTHPSFRGLSYWGRQPWTLVIHSLVSEKEKEVLTTTAFVWDKAIHQNSISQIMQIITTFHFMHEPLILTHERHTAKALGFF